MERNTGATEARIKAALSRYEEEGEKEKNCDCGWSGHKRHAYWCRSRSASPETPPTSSIEPREETEALRAALREASKEIRGAVDHCEGWRKFQDDDESVPPFPRLLEDDLRAVIARIEPLLATPNAGSVSEEKRVSGDIEEIAAKAAERVSELLGDDWNEKATAEIIKEALTSLQDKQKREDSLGETPLTQGVENEETGDAYCVIGDHPVFARPDRFGLSLNEATDYADQLRKSGFDNVIVREMPSGNARETTEVICMYCGGFHTEEQCQSHRETV